MSYIDEIVNSKWDINLRYSATPKKGRLQVMKDCRATRKRLTKFITSAKHFTMPANCKFEGAPFDLESGGTTSQKYGSLWNGHIPLPTEIHLPYNIITVSMASKGHLIPQINRKTFVLVREEKNGSPCGNHPLWELLPFQYVKGTWRYPMLSILMYSDGDKNHYKPEIFASCTREELDQDTETDREGILEELLDGNAHDIHVVANLLLALHNQPTAAITPNHPTKPSSHKARGRGRAKHIFKELVISSKYTPSTNGMGITTGITQRAHTRRGHERHYRNGKVIWIDSYKAGNASKGTINKDYRIQA